VKPREEGGPIARSGFNYQDEIAVGFLIEMLESPLLLKVHCETHDDVVLVRMVEESGAMVAEFVQVKGGEPDKLWSIADLCARKNGQAGTAIYEISLVRDAHREESRFRLVTLRPVVSNLKMLTFPFGAPGRQADGPQFMGLLSELIKRFPDLKSTKGNGAAYWLQNCFWDERHSEEVVRKDNLLRLINLSARDKRLLLPEQAETLLDELRALAKAAGAAKWDSDRDKKIITSKALSQWWEQRARELMEGAVATSGNKLREKMTAAGLPDAVIRLAIEMRLEYSAAARTARYMEPEESGRLQSRVKSEAQSLQAHLVDGRLEADGIRFHSLCLDRMDAVNAERPGGIEDRSAFLKGCMYDIADRCLLRFERSAQ